MGYFLARRPLGCVAIALVASEAILALLGVGTGLLAAAALLAPGFALAGLLPARVRSSRLATLAAVPSLGFAASSVAVITVASVGLELNGTVVRIVLLLLVAAGVLLSEAEEPWTPPTRAQLFTAGGLAAAVVLGAVLQGRVIAGSPVPGNDWAKYVLYADEIRSQGSMLIDNPFWMLGVPFREDPGVPAVYGAFLTLSGEP